MLQPTRRTAITLPIVAIAGICTADEVFLRGGGRLTGVVVERTRDTIAVETGPGRVTLAMSTVERVVEGQSALAAYRERAAALTPADVEGWVELARWAAESGLLTQSREAWRRALAADPSHPEANAALGRIEVDGVWMSREDSYRARGYVEFEGRWVTPAEHEVLVRERAFEEEAERQRREADLRVREAEARAREAEARAREAEAAAQPVNEGIPLWWGWGWAGGGYDPSPGTRPHRPRAPRSPGEPHPPGPHPRPHPTPAPEPSTQPSLPPWASAPPPATPWATGVSPSSKPRED